MRTTTLVLTGIATAAGLIWLSGSPVRSQAQNTTAAAPAKAPGLQCAPAPVPTPVPDPFKARLAGVFPTGLLPIDNKVRDSILTSGLPCQEHVSPAVGPEKEGLENLQRGFDFYSWRTFIAMNSPADLTKTIAQSQPNTQTRWEDPDNFKQLLDVMLPPSLPPPIWPTDPAAIEAERDRLVPEQCRALHKDAPKKMIVKMIEESFNEPFKTGPLIDQQGNYAIFDILMNRQMFKYMKDHELFSKKGQMSAANTGLKVDFPPGNDHPPGDDHPPATLGAFMLKVSWKILSQAEKDAKNFHMVDALVLMPVDPRLPLADREAKRPCLPETLGLIGFHAVHKTVGRPQWIWTSFEHKKNVPDRDEVAAKAFDGTYSFFSANCKVEDCPVNATPPRQYWQPDYALKLKFKDNKFKSQIVRETPQTDAAKNMNRIFQSMLHGTVWENYMLISTQWPTVFNGCTGLHSASAEAPLPNTDFVKQPDMTCSPAPTFMANSTLETYSQGDIPQASSSCIGCHNNAVGFQTGASDPKTGQVLLNQSDFTFMLEKAQ
jgi:hypothetical protein